jgi:hypothetical protein
VLVLILEIVGTCVNMSIFVQHSYTEARLLTIANVRVVVRTEPMPTVLGNTYQEYGPRFSLDRSQQVQETFASLRERLARRNWRQLREALVNLNLDDLPSVCEWLGSAGYVPQALLAEPNVVYFTAQDIQKISTDANFGWNSEFVTPEIRQWVRKYRDVFAWIMTLKDHQFRKAISTAREFARDELWAIQTSAREILNTGKKPKLKDPVKAFMMETGAPSDFDPHILGLALRGTAISEVAPAQLLWDYDGKPGVIAYANSPIDAICLSIHIDRNFSQRGWTQCARCGNWLDRVRGRDRFCSKKCRNYVTTTERRNKIKTLAEADNAWRAIPAQQRKHHDRWQWIAERVKRKSKSKREIEPSWAKQELTKMKTRKQTRGGENSQGGKNVTRKTR